MIKIGLESETKEELFEEMVQLFVQEGLITNRKAAVNALLEREAKMSTGIANGFALPHGKLEEVKGVIMALGVLRNSMDYDALDGEPVDVVIALFSELGNPAPHIEALAEISRHLSMPDFVSRIKVAQSAEEVLRIIKSEE